MKKKLENLFWIAIVVVVVGFGGFFILTNDFEHIEDINGANNYALNTITRHDIIKHNMGSKGLAYKTSDFKVAGIQFGGVEFSSKKYSGTEELFSIDFFLPSDFTLQVYNFEAKEGNCQLAVVNNGEIIATVEPGMDGYVHVPNVKGYTSIVLAGESANFSFEMTHTDFNMFNHPQYD